MGCGADDLTDVVLLVRGQPGLLPAGSARAEHDHRHGLLLIAGRAARGLREHPSRRVLGGHHGCRQRVAAPGQVRRPGPAQVPILRRTVPGLRRGRGRVRARRGRRGPGSQAARRRTARRRPRQGGDQVDRGQPRGSDQRLHRAGAQGSECCGVAGARPGGGGPGGRLVRGGSRHGNRRGRSHRDRGLGTSLRLRDRSPELRHRIREVEHRASRGGRGSCRRREVRAPDAAPRTGADAALRAG